ncbi:MAG: ADP-ribosylglycohydrolase family protein, partial [Myxococcota bacterium]
MLPSLVLFSTLIGYLAAGYLAYRAGLAWCRARWARHAYPRVAAPAPSTEWQRRCRGALLGLAVGDAVNLPAESLPRWLVRLRYPGGPAIRRGVIRFVRRPGDISD